MSIIPSEFIWGPLENEWQRHLFFYHGNKELDSHSNLIHSMNRLGSILHLILVWKLCGSEDWRSSRFLRGCSHLTTQEGSISTGLRFPTHLYVCFLYLQRKSLLDWLFQLKNFKVQGRMHCNDSRERIKLNTLSRLLRSFCLRCVGLSPGLASPSLQSRIPC